ncbi:hypothetical protein BBBOND_0313710 [Babesia bigemina]|uniref:Uncharacterized protein n=1 Tax=Babesia bigemina TaxID=5866 RepID=A0A061DDJ1_BABBI|nr:hypothetical protein BBBOND_0313710 [Babesia bigemina]CDR97469.1 hypothetical protein BBBOND_0313710 [Babesia bigemina]|eukprot:XP_012769655.1 hypothetical protein BBBOND_0313710 [Babesia bigemina]
MDNITQLYSNGDVYVLGKGETMYHFTNTTQIRADDKIRYTPPKSTQQTLSRQYGFAPRLRNTKKLRRKLTREATRQPMPRAPATYKHFAALRGANQQLLSRQ